MWRSFVAVSFFLGLTLGHMCMVNPYQRGGQVDLQQKANTDCFLTTGPCGGTSPDEHIRNFLVPDETWFFVLQKNLDHYNEANPGNFTINLLSKDNTFMTMLAVFPDTSDSTFTIYQPLGVVPSYLTQNENYIVQAIYYTNHGNNYYQCSDVIAQ